jgi:hypothetical protein
VTKGTELLYIQGKKGKVKGQGVFVYVMKAEWGVGVRSVVLNIEARQLYTMERNPLPTEQETGWAPDTL